MMAFGIRELDTIFRVGCTVPGCCTVAYTMMLYGQNEAFAGSASMVLRESAALQNTSARASA